MVCYNTQTIFFFSLIRHGLKNKGNHSPVVFRTFENIFFESEIRCNRDGGDTLDKVKKPTICETVFLVLSCYI